MEGAAQQGDIANKKRKQDLEEKRVDQKNQVVGEQKNQVVDEQKNQVVDEQQNEVDERALKRQKSDEEFARLLALVE